MIQSISAQRLTSLRRDILPVVRAGDATVIGEIDAGCSHRALPFQDVVVETLGKTGELILSKHGVCAGRFEKLFGEPV